MVPTPIGLLASAVGCACTDNVMIQHISTDSREITPGCIFVCIEGERFDGHAYARQALEAGASYIVAHKAIPVPPEKAFLVGNTLDANIALAGAYRRQFHPRMIGVTGSVGKTTTKEFISAVLSRQYRTLKTQGNRNNEIGVPHALLQLDGTTEAMVVEMGMNAAGDIAKLSKAVQPQVSVITGIGTSHIGLLGSRENIRDAKLEIVQGMPGAGTLLLNADNDLLRPITRLEGVEIRTFGIENPDAQVRASGIREQSLDEGGGTAFEIVCGSGRYPAFIPTIGRHNVLDALAAFAAGEAAGIAPSICAQGLADYAPAGMRQKIVRHAGFTVVEDCYNASPDSMRAAIDTLCKMDTHGRRIAVLGDMLELGDTTARAHWEIGSYCAQKGVDMLFFCGAAAPDAVRGAQEHGLEAAAGYADKAALAAALRQTARRDDILWFKASRGVQLEQVIQALYEA